MTRTGRLTSPALSARNRPPATQRVARITLNGPARTGPPPARGQRRPAPAGALNRRDLGADPRSGLGPLPRHPAGPRQTAAICSGGARPPARTRPSRPGAGRPGRAPAGPPGVPPGRRPAPARRRPGRAAGGAPGTARTAVAGPPAPRTGRRCRAVRPAGSPRRRRPARAARWPRPAPATAGVDDVEGGADGRLQQLEEDLVLAGEVVVERGLPDADAVGDGPRRRGREAGLGEQRRRGVEDLLARVCAAVVGGPGCGAVRPGPSRPARSPADAATTSPARRRGGEPRPGCGDLPRPLQGRRLGEEPAHHRPSSRVTAPIVMGCGRAATNAPNPPRQAPHLTGRRPPRGRAPCRLGRDGVEGEEAVLRRRGGRADEGGAGRDELVVQGLTGQVRSDDEQVHGHVGPPLLRAPPARGR